MSYNFCDAIIGLDLLLWCSISREAVRMNGGLSFLYKFYCNRYTNPQAYFQFTQGNGLVDNNDGKLGLGLVSKTFHITHKGKLWPGVSEGRSLEERKVITRRGLRISIYSKQYTLTTGILSPLGSSARTSLESVWIS